MSIIQAIAIGLIAVGWAAWPRLHDMLAGRSTKVRHLQDDCAALVDIATHFEAHERPEESKAALALITALVEIHNIEQSPTPVPLPSGRARHA